MVVSSQVSGLKRDDVRRLSHRELSRYLQVTCWLEQGLEEPNNSSCEVDIVLQKVYVWRIGEGCRLVNCAVSLHPVWPILVLMFLYNITIN